MANKSLRLLMMHNDVLKVLKEIPPNSLVMYINATGQLVKQSNAMLQF